MSSIHQEISFNAPPEAVYAALTEGDKFAEATGGAPAEIDGTDGGGISLFGGQIVGRNIELVENVRLVQAWRPGNWEDGVYSLVRIELAADGEGTKLTLDHTGYPDGAGEHLEGGWHQMYWQPLAAYLD